MFSQWYSWSCWLSAWLHNDHECWWYKSSDVGRTSEQWPPPASPTTSLTSWRRFQAEGEPYGRPGVHPQPYGESQSVKNSQPEPNQVPQLTHRLTLIWPLARSGMFWVGMDLTKQKLVQFLKPNDTQLHLWVEGIICNCSETMFFCIWGSMCLTSKRFNTFASSSKIGNGHLLVVASNVQHFISIMLVCKTDWNYYSN